MPPLWCEWIASRVGGGQWIPRLKGSVSAKVHVELAVDLLHTHTTETFVVLSLGWIEGHLLGDVGRKWNLPHSIADHFLPVVRQLVGWSGVKSLQHVNKAFLLVLLLLLCLWCFLIFLPSLLPLLQFFSCIIWLVQFLPLLHQSVYCVQICWQKWTWSYPWKKNREGEEHIHVVTMKTEMMKSNAKSR